MNETSINILMLLAQDTFTIDELSMYLNLEKNSISKGIKQINDFLEEENYPKIELKNNKCIMSLSKKEQEELFNKKMIMTSEEIYEYIYIKFVHDRFINLEEEREKLDLSRSSIFRIFTNIKKNLSDNDSKYRYIHGKGMELTHLSPNDLHLFFKTLVKYFFKKEFSLNRINLLDEELKNYNSKLLIVKLGKVFKENKISSSSFLISFLCALNICIKIFKEIDLKLERDYSKYKNLKNTLEIHLKEFDLRYQEQVFYFLANNLSNEVSFEPEILAKAKKLIPKLKITFDLKEIDIVFERMLLKKLCYSIFKYEGHILKVKKIEVKNIDSVILNILNDILEEDGVELYFSDKAMISQIIKKVIIETNKKTFKKIALLFNEITILNDDYLTQELKKYFKDYEFKIEPSFFYKIDKEFYENNFDLILSDEPSLKEEVKIINILNFNDIVESIHEHILENYLKRRKAPKI